MPAYTRAFDARMQPTRSRRDLLIGGAAVLATACARTRDAASSGAAAVSAAGSVERAGAALADVEREVGGRIGVFALDTGSGRAIGRRADERFAMCSTFKWLLAAAVLARVDRGELALDDRVPFTARDLLEHAPVTRARVAEGSMTVDALAESTVTVSDNTAANLLLARVGGPQGVTRFARGLGDGVTRLDRDEPGLNANDPGDPRDTTSPRAMVGLMRRVLAGDALLPGGRERLLGWMRACATGRERLRAGLPRDWVAGDKTGTGAHGAANDIAIAWPPDRAPILIAAFTSDSAADLAHFAAAHAAIARIVARTL